SRMMAGLTWWRSRWAEGGGGRTGEAGGRMRFRLLPLVVSWLTGDALVVVHGAERLEELDRLGIGLRALDGAVGHVHGRPAFAVHGLDIGAPRDEELDHLVVAACRGVVQGRIALVIRRVDVGAELVDEVLHGGEHARRRETM